MVLRAHATSYKLFICCSMISWPSHLSKLCCIHSGASLGIWIDGFDAFLKKGNFLVVASFSFKMCFFFNLKIDGFKHPSPKIMLACVFHLDVLNTDYIVQGKPWVNISPRFWNFSRHLKKLFPKSNAKSDIWYSLFLDKFFESAAFI